jgi:hypothetical protein
MGWRYFSGQFFPDARMNEAKMTTAWRFPRFSRLRRFTDTIANSLSVMLTAIVKMVNVISKDNRQMLQKFGCKVSKQTVCGKNPDEKLENKNHLKAKSMNHLKLHQNRQESEYQN